MEILFYVLCVTFFLSLFILKFKWFKKIGQWLAKPFVALMKRKRASKKNEVAKDEMTNRAKISQMQLRPVVLPPQLNAPSKEEKKELVQNEPAEEKKPVTMKEAFGDKNPFATRPIFPMAQVDYERRTQASSRQLGTKFEQSLPKVQPNGQGRVSLDFLDMQGKDRANVGRMPSGATLSASPFKPASKDVFVMPKGLGNSMDRGGFACWEMGQDATFSSKKTRHNSFAFDEKFEQNPYDFREKTMQNPFATGERKVEMPFAAKGGGTASGVRMGGFLDKSSADMDAIIAKRKAEFNSYKKQKDNLKIDGQDVDIAGLPPKLKRILVMGILDQKKYD